MFVVFVFFLLAEVLYAFTFTLPAGSFLTPNNDVIPSKYSGKCFTCDSVLLVLVLLAAVLCTIVELSVVTLSHHRGMKEIKH